MSTWTVDELKKVGEADELQIASYRADGSLRPYVTIWVVRSGDEIYVRSAYGYENGWFRRARTSDTGCIKAGGVERNVTFVEPGPEVADAVTAVYHSKYDHYGQQYVGPCVDTEAVRSTLRLIPS